MITTIINNRLRISISLHDNLHRFRQGRGTGTATLEAKLVQHLAGIFHKPLFQVLLDANKVYESLDRMKCMEILRGYEIGKNLKSLLDRLWEGQMVVTRAGGCSGLPF